ncbi:MAG: hypothetical protein KF804_08790 [Burkholderiales bacterium]|nr:hypothetical protein [Burkholderiales bacterium]
MIRNKDSFVFWSAMAIAVLLLAGCDALPFGDTPIRDITAAPANFEGKEVKLRGKVTSVTKLPILDLRSYTLQDATGEISVTTRGELPAADETVGLRGTVRSAAIIGGQSLGLRVEEIRRF